MTEHKAHVERNPMGTRFWWVCTCGDKASKRVSYSGYAALAGDHHVRDKAAQ